MGVDVHADGLQDLQDRLPTEKLARTAATRAINRAMDAGKVAAVREVVKVYAVKRAKINERVTSKKASPNDLEATVTWQGRPLNLVSFKVTPSKPQPALRPVIKVMTKKSDGLRPEPGMFLANVRTGTRVFSRSGDTRLPIQSESGPSTPQMLGEQSVVDAVRLRSGEVMEARLEHEIMRALDKL